MQVQIIGHVPPTAGNYFPRCFDVYTELILRFQDTVIGQHFGHMNLDAFFVQESSLVKWHNRPRKSAPPVIMKHIEEDLRHDYESLPGAARTDLDLYGIFYIGPSVVPTYLPSVRVWTYNTSLEHSNRPFRTMSANEVKDLLDFVAFDSCDDEDTSDDCELVDETNDELEISEDIEPLIKGRDHRRPRRKHRRRHRKLPRYASPFSPSRRNTFLTPLGYSQWVLNLPAANKKAAKSNNPSQLTLVYDLEYATYEPSTLWHQFIDELFDQHNNLELMDKTHHHASPSQHHVPVPRPLLELKLQALNLKSPFTCNSDLSRCKFDKRAKHISNYNRQDLTIPSLMDLGRRLVLSNKLWKSYVHRMYSNSLLNDETVLI